MDFRIARLFSDAGKSQLTSNHPVFVSFANCINVLDVFSFHSYSLSFQNSDQLVEK